MMEPPGRRSLIARLLAAPAFYAALAAVLVSSLLLPDIVASLRLPVEEIDEAAVYFSTCYYDLAFVRHDAHAAEWQAQDAYDHPPGWKYAYGAVLHAAGQPRGTLSDKRSWYRLAWGTPPPGSGQGTGISDFIDRHVPLSALVPMRVAAAAFVLLALALLFVLAARVAAPPTALLAVGLAASHPALRGVASRALIDPLLLLLLLLAAWTSAHWLEAGARRGRSGYAWSLALGIVLALLASTKITGVAAIGGVACAAGLQLGARARGERRAPAVRLVWRFLLVAGTALVLAIALDPTLWPDPIGAFHAMVVYRAQQLGAQMRAYPGAQASLAAGALRFLQQALLVPDPSWGWIRLPVVALAALVGLVRFLRRADWGSPWTCAIAGNGLLWLVVTAATYRMDWPRYTLPALPWLAFLVAFACEPLLHLALGRARPARAGTAAAPVR